MLQNCQKHSLLKNFLQVVYCNARHHCIVVSNMECKKGLVNIYNSLFTSLDEETLMTINNYLGEQNAKCRVQCNVVEAQRQQETKNSGPFVVDFLTSLAYNQDPGDGPIKYCQAVYMIVSLGENLCPFLQFDPSNAAMNN